MKIINSLVECLENFGNMKKGMLNGRMERNKKILY